MSTPERPVEREIAPATPEGVAIGLAASQVGFLNLAIQTGVTLALRETLQFVPPEILATAAAVVFVGTVVTGVLYEAHILEKIGFTVNPVTTLAHLKIENPILSSIVGNIYSQLSFFWSPVNLGLSLSSLALHDGGLLLYSNLLARSITSFVFYNGLNFALYHGHAEKLAAKIHDLRLKVTGPALDNLDHARIGLEKSITTATFIAAYQEGNISYQEMVESIHASSQKD